MTSLNQSSSFALSTGFNSKTVKLWIKDRAGNVSSTSSSILRVDPNQPPSLAKSWVEDFESNLAKPSPFNRSRLFRRDHRKAASGHFSLVLQVPSRGIETGRFAGGDIVKVALPKTIHDYYSISIKTHLEELGRGRVILRASFFKLVSRPGSTGKEGIRLRTIELGNIDSYSLLTIFSE